MVIQWKLPLTLSNFIQRAGRAARDSNRHGIAILLVERSAYAQSNLARPRSTRTRKAKNNVGTTQLVSSQPVSSAQKKASKDYAEAHGLKRGTRTGLHDTAPTGTAPIVDPDAADEGLLALVQSVTCRRQVWTEVYDAQHLAGILAAS